MRLSKKLCQNDHSKNSETYGWGIRLISVYSDTIKFHYIKPILLVKKLRSCNVDSNVMSKVSVSQFKQLMNEWVNIFGVDGGILSQPGWKTVLSMHEYDTLIVFFCYFYDS